MSEELSSTMLLLLGNPLNGRARVALEVQTVTGVQEFSFFERRGVVGDQSQVLLQVIRSSENELGLLNLPSNCYQQIVTLDRAGLGDPVHLVRALGLIPRTLSTIKGAGVVWFTISELQELYERTKKNPADSFVMTLATRYMYQLLVAQERLSKLEAIAA